MSQYLTLVLMILVVSTLAFTQERPVLPEVQASQKFAKFDWRGAQAEFQPRFEMPRAPLPPPARSASVSTETIFQKGRWFRVVSMVNARQIGQDVYYQTRERPKILIFGDWQPLVRIDLRNDAQNRRSFSLGFRKYF